MIRSDFWDDGEKEARLRQMVEAHLSSGAIAVALGCSRNAVIGKCKRLHLRLTGFVKDGQSNATLGAEPRFEPRFEPKVRSPRLPDIPRTAARPRTETRASAPVPTPFDTLSGWQDAIAELPEVVHEEPMDDLPGVAFADLNSTHCRAIGANGRYCGAPIAHEKFSYCTEHAKRYLTTPARLRAQQNEEAAAEGRSKLGRWA